MKQSFMLQWNFQLPDTSNQRTLPISGQKCSLRWCPLIGSSTDLSLVKYIGDIVESPISGHHRCRARCPLIGDVRQLEVKFNLTLQRPMLTKGNKRSGLYLSPHTAFPVNDMKNVRIYFLLLLQRLKGNKRFPFFLLNLRNIWALWPSCTKS